MAFRSICVIFTWFAVFTVCLTAKSPTKASDTSGPYTLVPLRVENCTKPKLPYTTEPMMENHVIIKKNIISGNVTVLKEIKNTMSSIEDFYYENGKRVLTFQVKKLTCHTRFHQYLVKEAGIVMDNKTCTVPKRTFPFSVDFNKFEHLWASTREYGRLTRRIETFNKTRTIACFEYDFDVRPIK